MGHWKNGMLEYWLLQNEIEVVSKCQIAVESKAQADEKAPHTLKYVSILKRSATQLSDARWGFETTSKFISSVIPEAPGN
jgi:hypothetical protein